MFIRPPFRRHSGRFLLGVLAVGLMPLAGRAYVLEGPSWPGNTTVVMHLELGATNRKLSDGFATWDDSAADALRLWNQYLGDGVQFEAVVGSGAPNADGNGVNTVSYRADVYGQAFGGDVLAVSVLSSTDDSTAFLEADVLFNTAWKWDSYRGPLRPDPTTKKTLIDFHRVAIHEFGHVLGLDHPDEHKQKVGAIMNSTVSNVDVMQADDITGGQFIYRTVGRLMKTFDLKASRLLVDPVRPRLYATLPLDDAIAVIDTDTLAVLANLPIGSKPTDLAISSDNSRLYVANSGASVAGIGVVDLNTLNVLSGLSLPFKPAAVAAGVGDRLYLLNLGDNSSVSARGVTQIDAVTGAIQGNFGGISIGFPGFLQISPDRNTLYYGDAGNYPANLIRLDVSSAQGVVQQRNPFGTLGSNGEQIAVSHHGRFFCFLTATGNDGSLSNYNYGVRLIPTNDLDGVLGTFQTGPLPEKAVFSPDDRLLYESGNGRAGIQVFSTETFALVNSFTLPSQPDSGQDFPAEATSLAATSGAAGYLFVANTNIVAGNIIYAGPLQVYRALSNPPHVSQEVPAVSVMGNPTRGGFVLSRANSSLNFDLTVACHNGGSAIRGGDYVAFPTSVTIPAGHSEAVIPVTLLPGANRNRKVKVFLDPGDDYQVGKAQSKVFLSELP